jgi:hypothetical protein
MNKKLENRTRSVECLTFNEYGFGSIPNVFLNLVIDLYKIPIV